MGQPRDPPEATTRSSSRTRHSRSQLRTTRTTRIRTPTTTSRECKRCAPTPWATSAHHVSVSLKLPAASKVSSSVCQVITNSISRSYLSSKVKQMTLHTGTVSFLLQETTLRRPTKKSPSIVLSKRRRGMALTVKFSGYLDLHTSGLVRSSSLSGGALRFNDCEERTQRLPLQQHNNQKPIPPTTSNSKCLQHKNKVKELEPSVTLLTN